MQYIAKDGFPVERIMGRPITNFIRLLIHTKKIKMDRKLTIRRISFLIGMFYNWNIKKPILYKLCNHKEIEIYGDSIHINANFSCKKCHKQFKYVGGNLATSSK